MFDTSPDLPVFLQDFGIDFIAPSGAVFRALVDQPDEESEGRHVRSVSRTTTLTYASSAVTLAVWDTVTQVVGAQVWTVREPPMQTSDGAFSKVVVNRA
jgi:hypothetical protein